MKYVFLCTMDKTEDVSLVKKREGWLSKDANEVSFTNHCEDWILTTVK